MEFERVGRIRVRESDGSYFKRRAGEERLAAERATDPCAQRVHLDLADRYDDAAAAVQMKIGLAGIAASPAIAAMRVSR
jgi:hypothetical protein